MPPIFTSATPQNAPLRGRVRVAGDKSISHRALMLGAVAVGTTEIYGLLEGDDVKATAAALKKCGVKIEQDKICWRVVGRGAAGLCAPESALDFGNAGTGVRLAMGLLSGAGVAAEYSGDKSLSARPMRRIVAPLAKMGVAVKDNAGCLPLTLTPPSFATGGELLPLDYTTPHPSAQIKSALLFAGLGAAGEMRICERQPTRDHSENMLRLFGVEVLSEQNSAGQIITMRGGQLLTAPSEPLIIPSDPSSAAFLLVAASVIPDSDIILENIMLNPRRDGLVRVLRQMGADITAANPRQCGGEQVADLRVKYAPLRGVEVPANIAADMIDEYPALAIAAAFARGATTMLGLAELKVKESDRLAAIAAGLSANNIKYEVGKNGSEDSLIVFGCEKEREKDKIGGGLVATEHDHRIAMAFLILGLAGDKAVRIDDAAMIATSYPNFFSDLQSLGAEFK